MIYRIRKLIRSNYLTTYQIAFNLTLVLISLTNILFDYLPPKATLFILIIALVEIPNSWLINREKLKYRAICEMVDSGFIDLLNTAKEYDRLIADKNIVKAYVIGSSIRLISTYTYGVDKKLISFDEFCWLTRCILHIADAVTENECDMDQ